MATDLNLYKISSMKKFIAILLVVCTVIGCHYQESKKEGKTPADAIKDTSKPKVKKDSAELKSKDSILLQLSNEILAAVKQKNFEKLAAFVHPVSGVRFSPYAFVDTMNHQRILPSQLINISQQKKALIWGTRDGSGEPIKQNINKYFDEFVYDADFINAPQKAVNKILASGNSLNNLTTIYPTADLTEFYFPGFDPKYAGMDWKTLRLVFQTENSRLWLIAIIHDQWTI